MEKIKNIINWIGTDGLLHLLACYALMLTFSPLGFGWASAVTWAIAIAKEAADIARKSNNIQQALNDIIRDAIGWGCGTIVIIIQNLM